MYDPIKTEAERVKWRNLAARVTFGRLDGDPWFLVTVSPWGVVVAVVRDATDAETGNLCDLGVTYPLPPFPTGPDADMRAADVLVGFVVGNAVHEVHEHARLDGVRRWDPHKAPAPPAPPAPPASSPLCGCGHTKRMHFVSRQGIGRQGDPYGCSVFNPDGNVCRCMKVFPET